MTLCSLHRKTLAEWECKSSNPVLNPLNHNSVHFQPFCSQKLARISLPSSCKRPNIWNTAEGAEPSHETCRERCHSLSRVAAAVFALMVGSISSYNFYLFISLQCSSYPLQAHCLDTSDHRYSLIKQHRSGELCKGTMAHNVYSFPNWGSKCTGRNRAGPGDAASAN